MHCLIGPYLAISDFWNADAIRAAMEKKQSRFSPNGLYNHHCSCRTCPYQLFCNQLQRCRVCGAWNRAKQRFDVGKVPTQIIVMSMVHANVTCFENLPQSNFLLAGHRKCFQQGLYTRPWNAGHLTWILDASNWGTKPWMSLMSFETSSFCVCLRGWVLYNTIVQDVLGLSADGCSTHNQLQGAC